MYVGTIERPNPGDLAFRDKLLAQDPNADFTVWTFELRPGITFLVIAALYVGVAVSLVLILRKMSARFRAGDAELDRGGPYGPREPVAVGVGADAGADS